MFGYKKMEGYIISTLQMEGPRFCDTLRFRIFFVRLFASSLCKLAPLRQNTRTTQLTLIKSRKPRQVTEPGTFHLQLVMVYRRNLANLRCSWLTCYGTSLFWGTQIPGFMDSHSSNTPPSHPISATSLTLLQTTSH